MARVRRPTLVALAALLACLLTAPASRATTIDAGGLDVTTNESGALQANDDAGMRLFFSSGSSGFFLRFTDGPLSGRTYGPGWFGSSHVTPVSQSAVTRVGDTQSQTTVFAVRDGDTEVARVNQVTRVRDGARGFRVTYSIENRSLAPLRFRALSGGDLYVGGGDGGNGVAIAGPPRFIGGESPYTGIRGGAEQVLSSQLPADVAAVAVAPWSAAQEGWLGSIPAAMDSEAGLTDGIVPEYAGDIAAAVQWDDHNSAETALAPAATARYELLWHVVIPPRLSLQTPLASRYLGDTQTIDARLVDAAGAAVGGAALRWSVSGTNPTAAPADVRTDAAGHAMISYAGAREGSDTVTVFADADGDGQRDPDEPQRTTSVYWNSPLMLEQTSWGTERVGSTQRFRATLRGADGTGRPGAQLRWRVSGANPAPTAAVLTGDGGTADIALTARQSGSDVLTVFADGDGDGELDAGEPSASRSLYWSPPPVTRQTLDGAGLNATVSSVGGLQAQFDALPGIASQSLFDEYPGGVFVRFFDGPLAGQVFSTNGDQPFYGESQEAPMRDGDVVSQRSSWTVRNSQQDYLRVRQLARLRDGEDSVRLTWELENLSDAAVRVRLGTVGDVIVEGNEIGTAVSDSSPRFVGIEGPSGFAAGIEEVATSRLPGGSGERPIAPWSGFGIDGAWSLNYYAGALSGLGTSVPETAYGDAVGVQWDDHAGDGQALAAGVAGAARYEAVWRLRRPAALRLSPPSAVAETRHEHRITATLLDDHRLPRNGVRLRWTISGANPRSGSAVSSGLGQAVIAWTGRDVGRDTVTVFADEDDDGVRDVGEAQRSVTVDWRLESAVDPPTIAPIVRPDGSIVPVNIQTQNGQVFFGIIPSQVSSLPRCADGSPQVNITLSVNIDGAAGQVVAGSASLLGLDSATLDLLHPIDSILPLGLPVGGTFQFVLQCLRPTSLYVCYDLEELGLPIEHFCVSLGGIGFYDPAGTVYDADAAAQLVSNGVSEAQARQRSAIAGARVVLQRSFEGAFRQVLSGDPYVTPNVNPIVTAAGGHFSWNVSPGTYRVVASAQGYSPETSRSVAIPPPDLDLHVGLHRDGAPLPDPPPATEPGTSTSSHPAGSPGEPTAMPPSDDGPSETPPSGGVDESPPPAASPERPATLPPPSTTPNAATPSALTVPPRPASRPRAPSAPAPPIVAAPRPGSAANAPGSPCRLHAVGKPKLDRRGVMRVRLACTGPTSSSGRLQIVAADETVLASARFTVAPGASRRIDVRLGSRARRTLRSSAATRVGVLVVPAGGTPAVLGTARVSWRR